jgi:hypothetical protein
MPILKKPIKEINLTQGYNYNHYTKTSSWENVIGDIFSSVVNIWSNGDGVIYRSNFSEPNLDRPKTLIGSNVRSDVKRCLENFTNRNFYELLQKEKEQKPDVYDCYKIKKGFDLRKNTRVYFIHHENDKEKNAIIVFSGLYLAKHLEQRVSQISDILELADENALSGETQSNEQITLSQIPGKLIHLKSYSDKKVQEFLDYLIEEKQKNDLGLRRGIEVHSKLTLLEKIHDKRKKRKL